MREGLPRDVGSRPLIRHRRSSHKMPRPGRIQGRGIRSGSRSPGTGSWSRSSSHAEGIAAAISGRSPCRSASRTAGPSLANPTDLHRAPPRCARSSGLEGVSQTVGQPRPFIDTSTDFLYAELIFRAPGGHQEAGYGGPVVCAITRSGFFCAPNTPGMRREVDGHGRPAVNSGSTSLRSSRSSQVRQAGPTFIPGIEPNPFPETSRRKP